MANLVCSDPLHASRSAEPGWAATLGTGDKAIAGLLCQACAAHLPQALPPANVLASVKALTPEQQQRLLVALLTGAKPSDVGVTLPLTTDPKTAPVVATALRTPRPPHHNLQRSNRADSSPTECGMDRHFQRFTGEVLHRRGAERCGDSRPRLGSS